MTDQDKTSTALLKWGQDTTQLTSFLRQIFAILRDVEKERENNQVDHKGSTQLKTVSSKGLRQPPFGIL